MTNEPTPLSATPLQTSAFDPRLREEVDAVFWVFEQVRLGYPLPVIEAAAVAHSLYVSMRLDGNAVIPQLPLHDMREYNAVHGINVALLAMGGAEALGIDEAGVRAIGLAGLLADIGMVRVPIEIIAKAEQLKEDERALVMRHPIDGAQIIAAADANLDLAAIVAYEHHIHFAGGGYPALTYPRKRHRVAGLVSVCDAYHALRSPRPFREAWPPHIVFSFLHQRAGYEFDPDIVRVVTKLLRSAEEPPPHGS